MAIVPSFSLQRLDQRFHLPPKAKLDLQQALQQVHLRNRQIALQAPHPRLPHQQHVSSASGILMIKEKYALMTNWGSNRMPLVTNVARLSFHPMDALGAMTARLVNAGQDLRLTIQPNILLQRRPTSQVNHRKWSFCYSSFVCALHISEYFWSESWADHLSFPFFIAGLWAQLRTQLSIQLNHRESNFFFLLCTLLITYPWTEADLLVLFFLRRTYYPTVSPVSSSSSCCESYPSLSSSIDTMFPCANSHNVFSFSLLQQH